MLSPKEMEKPRERANDKNHTKKKKAIKASMEWTPANEKEPRSRKPTQRYGIVVVMQVEENEPLGIDKKNWNGMKLKLKNIKPCWSHVIWNE